MKFVLLLVLSAFLSAPCFANDFGLVAIPESPIVVTSDLTLPDGTIVKGPWTKVNLKITTAKELHINYVRVEGASQEKASTLKHYFPTMHLLAGETAEYLIYISLPPSASTAYDVFLSVEGNALVNHEVEFAFAAVEFKTQ